jgi:hypothetical protein
MANVYNPTRTKNCCHPPALLSISLGLKSLQYS